MHVCEKQTDSVTRFHHGVYLSNHLTVWYKCVVIHILVHFIWHVMFVCLHVVSCSCACAYHLGKNLSVQ